MDYDYYGDLAYGRPAVPNPMIPNPMMSNPMAQDQYIMAENLRAALQLIREAVTSEKEDELFYDYLISAAPSEEEKKIIESIRDDERKHFKMFRELYFELTGRRLPTPPEPEFVKPASYEAGLEKALFGELGAVEKYRKILFGLQRRKDINKLTEIITDELKHAHKYNYLYTKNKAMK